MTRPRSQHGGAPVWALILVPLVLLAGLLWLVVGSDPSAAIRGNAPAVEELVFQRVELGADGIRARLLNDGPDPVTIAQVIIDEAYWSFSQTPAGELGHLGQATLDIPYPWVESETHELRVITASGITFDHEIAVATTSPRPSARFFFVFALIGLYVGVIPVALGLLWYPAVGRLGRHGLDFVLALTIGLLLFLLLDTLEDGLELAGRVAASFQGPILLLGTALAAFFSIETLGAWLRARRPEAGAAGVTSLLIAIGIGLHNFGEGLAIGAAYSVGEVSLGALLIVGFTLHNTTEGLAIVAPLAESRVSVWHFVLVGLIAGAPTIAGTWTGGFVYSPTWSVVFFGIAAGAIAQVVMQITRQVAGERAFTSLVANRPVMGGLLAGFAIMYATGMLV